MYFFLNNRDRKPYIVKVESINIALLSSLAVDKLLLNKITGVDKLKTRCKSRSAIYFLTPLEGNNYLTNKIISENNLSIAYLLK